MNIKVSQRKERIKKEDSRLLITETLSQGMNQLIQYMKNTNLFSSILVDGLYKIKHPKGFIVIGYNLGKEQEDMMEEWNFHLKPHIKIMTYNSLIRSGANQLANIKKARELDKNDIKK